VYDGEKKLLCQKSSVRPVVSIRCRLVTDGHRIEGLTDGQTHEDSVGYCTSMASRGKKCAAGPSVSVRSTIIPAVGRRNSRKFRTRRRRTNKTRMTARRAVYGRSTAAVVGDASHSRTLRRSPRLLHLHPIHTAHRTRRQNCRACVAWPGRIGQQGAKVCRYNSHSAGSPGLPLTIFIRPPHSRQIQTDRQRDRQNTTYKYN